MPAKIARAAYADMFGPTTGDKATNSFCQHTKEKAEVCL